MIVDLTVCRSKNVYRSVAALTSLIRVASSDRQSIGPFFAAVSRAEPVIDHVDAEVEALDMSEQKQYFQLLVRLAKISVLLQTPLGTSEMSFHKLRQNLNQLLQVYTYVSVCRLWGT